MVEILEGKLESPLKGRFRMSRTPGGVFSRRGGVYYSVVEDRVVQPTNARMGQRHKSRLQSAKILDANGRFLCDCLVWDRSHSGMRLQLMSSLDLPDRLVIYDDASGALVSALKVWRRGAAMGVRVAAVRGPRLKRTMRTALRTGFYAVRD